MPFATLYFFASAITLSPFERESFICLATASVIVAEGFFSPDNKPLLASYGRAYH
jgi:hypothetical protein